MAGKCELCAKGIPILPASCRSCGELFHFHLGQPPLGNHGITIIQRCPKCDVTNVFRRTGNRIEALVLSGSIHQNPPQPGEVPWWAN